MIKSMTGYGAARYDTSGSKVSVELRTLNSKYLDVMIKLPREFSDQEIKVKSLIGDRLQRGKINLTIDYLNESNISSNQIDERILLSYYNQLKKVSEESGETSVNCFEIAAKMPDVIAPSENKPSDEEWQKIQSVILEAVENCSIHRISEGEKLAPILLENCRVIAAKLILIEEADPKRVENIKKRINGNLKEHLGNDVIDQNRFEQEVIYFLEKLDITEEKVRLKSHLDYFEEILNAKESQGKKLGFITQEIGREINTIGSKANNATIQHLVVEMKEELEKIREQLLNIL